MLKSQKDTGSMQKTGGTTSSKWIVWKINNHLAKQSGQLLCRKK